MRWGRISAANHREHAGMGKSRLWHILFTMSGEEAQAETWLARYAGSEMSFFPSEVHWRRMPKAGRNKPKKIPVIKAVVPGYLFVSFRDVPRFDLIRAKCRHVHGFMKIGDRPVVVTEGVLMRMQQMPEHLANLKEERERLVREARTFRPGDTATVTEGMFEGWEITVSDVKGEVVIFDTPIGLAKVSSDALEKRAQ